MCAYTRACVHTCVAVNLATRQDFEGGVDGIDERKYSVHRSYHIFMLHVQQ